MRIGEVSQLSGVSVRMLRHYDRTGLVVPSARTSAAYRDYSTDDLRRLMQVEALRSLGLGLAETRRALDDPALDTVAVLTRLRTGTQARIRAEQELLDHLDAAGEPGTRDDVLRLTTQLTALREGHPR
ncbi:MerR family transcriptional regulator [Corynebacterium terpenotabidum]|uniref:Transcriptional regulator n=1 Tax=Corynebacterium terpenotabidum Y-11 TaxID=1200352 RepID=S4XAA1_9CORY|nr:MerR family transcriptional regulator [Corynebacterium terpenotabidum]AGP30057.1 transcriptional regulator [Corynebacterium terpenotabidum Y-11]